MKSVFTLKFIGRVLILAFLIIGIVFVAKVEQPVCATGCCWDCEPYYQNCLSGAQETCDGDPVCENNYIQVCRNGRRSCYTNCSYSCNPGEPNERCCYTYSTVCYDDNNNPYSCEAIYCGTCP